MGSETMPTLTKSDSLLVGYDELLEIEEFEDAIKKFLKGCTGKLVAYNRGNAFEIKCVGETETG